MYVALDETPKMKWAGLGTLDDSYILNPLPQKLSTAVPYGSLWVVEAKDYCGSKSIVYAGDPPQSSAKLTFSVIGSLASSVDLIPADLKLRAYAEAYKEGREFPFWAVQGCMDADFTVTYWDFISDPQQGPWDQIDATILAGPNARYDNIKMRLQQWFGVSVDELASLLSLSPTTLINLAKPSHVVRPKTVRKMMIVYGLLNELVRVVGAESALTWARTIGYRLLSEGNLGDFERFVSTRIFPTLDRVPRDSRVFGDNDVELDLKPAQPIGRPSRI